MEHINQGLAYAHTDSARTKVASLLPENIAAVEEDLSDSAVQLPLMRLLPEEVGNRPVAVAGMWGQVGGVRSMCD